MKLDCYRIHDQAPEIVPARAGRDWMNEPGPRFAHRCTPLTMANSTSWELLCTIGLTASWNGGPAPDDLTIEFDATPAGKSSFAESKFGHGVLTFDPGYLFRTDPEWAIWCRGAPNAPNVLLEGLVETDWLTVPFAMSWRFTQPGTVGLYWSIKDDHGG
jgi:Family of unknown function (DUF6065)